MFIGTNYETLLGDLPVSAGINARLITMYLGVPWVSTDLASNSIFTWILLRKAGLFRPVQIGCRERARVHWLVRYCGSTIAYRPSHSLALLPFNRLIGDC